MDRSDTPTLNQIQHTVSSQHDYDKSPTPTHFVSGDGVLFTFDATHLARLSTYFAKPRPDPGATAVAWVIKVYYGALNYAFQLLLDLEAGSTAELIWPHARVIVGLVKLIKFYDLPVVGRALLARSSEASCRKNALQWLLIASALGDDLHNPIRATIRYGLDVDGLDLLLARANVDVIDCFHKLLPDALAQLTATHRQWEGCLKLFKKNFMYNVYQLDCAQCGFAPTVYPHCSLGGYTHFHHVGEAMRPSFRLSVIDNVLIHVWRYLRGRDAPWELEHIERWARELGGDEALTGLLVHHVPVLTTFLMPRNSGRVWANMEGQ
ncbi:uncharacterized protein LOC62_04G006594 [Vanrija pseudolonga]|uniref:Uncharacterized protein n=1 Tax=Vanrija pseudolonga TaxID=143232 RepID=A0AAF1BS84_9TREE|nr:hypothetical protein LOC62_04G006594 [Vanrija pseudolonga]